MKPKPQDLDLVSLLHGSVKAGLGLSAIAESLVVRGETARDRQCSIESLAPHLPDPKSGCSESRLKT